MLRNLATPRQQKLACPTRRLNRCCSHAEGLTQERISGTGRDGNVFLLHNDAYDPSDVCAGAAWDDVHAIGSGESGARVATGWTACVSGVLFVIFFVLAMRYLRRDESLDQQPAAAVVKN